MKQGSTDDPFAEDDESAADAEETVNGQETTVADRNPPADETDRVDTSDSADDNRRGSSPTGGQRQSLPYIHSRDGVKDGRTQRPVFLREHVEAGIDDLVDRMEAELGEDVYKTDVTEAAMAVAEENPELVLAKLEEWGYGWS